MILNKIMAKRTEQHSNTKLHLGKQTLTTVSLCLYKVKYKNDTYT